ncbi:MBL fold metallo-hydrolase [soil metagenome]
MKVQQHGLNLFQLSRYVAFNSFLVREDDGLTVVDTNMGGNAPAIVSAAASLGLPITRIVLTHSHIDHVGSLDALHALVPEAEVLISRREARFLNGERTLEPAEQKPGAKLRGGYTTCETVPTRLLHDGDAVGSLQVVASPGHTPGHVALFDPRDGTLLAGDAFQTQAGVAVAGQVRPLFPLPALATYHAPTAVESARRLLELKPTRLAVGHGKVLEQPVSAMKRIIEKGERSADRLHLA